MPTATTPRSAPVTTPRSDARSETQAPRLTAKRLTARPSIRTGSAKSDPALPSVTRRVGTVVAKAIDEKAETAAARARLVTRLQRIAGLGLDYIGSPEFDQPEQAEALLADPVVERRSTRRPSLPADVPAYVAALYDVALLAPQEERQLFRRMNYCKARANALRATLHPQRPAMKKLAEIERLAAQAAADRDRILQANLRLVVANARTFADQDHRFDDLVSDGNLSLIQAIEKFDYSRGFRFSTYATHAIRRTYFRRMAKKQREKTRLTFTAPEVLQEAPQQDSLESDDVNDTLLYRRLLECMPSHLNERELSIVKARFSIGTSDEAPTLHAMAGTMGICKERVRQLQNRALEKLKELATQIRREFELIQPTLADAELLPAGV